MGYTIGDEVNDAGAAVATIGGDLGRRLREPDLRHSGGDGHRPRREVQLAALLGKGGLRFVTGGPSSPPVTRFWPSESTGDKISLPQVSSARGEYSQMFVTAVPKERFRNSVFEI